MSESRTPEDTEADPVDEAVEESFPASDPPAQGGTTGPGEPAGSGAPGPRTP